MDTYNQIKLWSGCCLLVQVQPARLLLGVA